MYILKTNSHDANHLFIVTLALKQLLTGLPLGENEENPQDSYTNLRQLVQRIIEEVFKLPELFEQPKKSESSITNEKPLPQFEPKKYEELLATAVLNKVSTKNNNL